ncbi:MAG: hypothetical protein FJ299_11210 [Planctomycetes bacterium]|nr:hypothetical protein [Planctomycetota bacterium]
MRRNVLLIALLGAITAGVLWLLWQERAPAARVAEAPAIQGASQQQAPAQLEIDASVKVTGSAGAAVAVRSSVAASEGAPAPVADAARSWVVRVRDRGGRPIPDLACELREHALDGRSSEAVWNGSTDERGELSLPPAIWQRIGPGKPRLTVEPLALLTRSIALVLEGSAPPPGGSELWLPELGRVDVKLLDPEGRVFEADLGHGGFGDAWVRNAAAERPPLRAGPNIAYAVPRESAPLYAETGLELEGIYVLSNPEAEALGRARGPLQPFERVELPIRVGALLPIARMRVLDAQGPYAGKVLLVGRRRHRPGGSSSAGGMAGRTDGDGILLVPLQPEDAATRTLLMLADAEPPRLQALVPLPALPASGWVDVGDVRLAAPELLVAGVVVDESGAPVPGAAVTVVGRLRAEFDSEPPPEMRAHHAKFPFFGGPSWTIAADEQGRFELRAHALCAELQLRAKAPGLPRTDPQVCAAGTTDVRILMTRGGALEGRVLLSQQMQPQELRLTLETESVPGVSDSEDQVQPALAADGVWSASGLRPGEWKIQLNDARVFSWEPLVPAVKAQVVAGTTIRVPDIDLAGGTRALKIEVVDEAGLPVAAAQGTFHGPGSSSNNDIDVRDGRATLLTKHASVEAWFGGPGYLCQRVADLRDGARVVLRAAPRIELVLHDLAALPPEPYLLCVQLDPGLGADNWMLREISSSSSAAFDRAGRASVELRATGALHVEASVRSGTLESDARVEWLSGANGGPLELSGVAPDAPIALAIDAALVQAALQKLTALR